MNNGVPILLFLPLMAFFLLYLFGAVLSMRRIGKVTLLRVQVWDLVLMVSLWRVSTDAGDHEYRQEVEDLKHQVRRKEAK